MGKLRGIGNWGLRSFGFGGYLPMKIGLGVRGVRESQVRGNLVRRRC